MSGVNKIIGEFTGEIEADFLAQYMAITRPIEEEETKDIEIKPVTFTPGMYDVSAKNTVSELDPWEMGEMFYCDYGDCPQRHYAHSHDSYLMDDYFDTQVEKKASYTYLKPILEDNSDVDSEEDPSPSPIYEKGSSIIDDQQYDEDPCLNIQIGRLYARTPHGSSANLEEDCLNSQVVEDLP